MLRRISALFSSLIVAFLLVVATSALASETLSVSASGTISVDGARPINTTVSILKMLRTDANGVITRNVFSGSIRLFGFIDSQLVSVSLPANSVKMENGWAIISCAIIVKGVTCTFEVSVSPRTSNSLGSIRCRIVDRNASLVSYPLARNNSDTFNTFEYRDGGVAISYLKY